MYKTGHYGVALLAYAPVLYAYASRGSVVAAVAGGGLVLAFAMLPDADHDLPFVDHRGVTHTVPFVAAVAAVVGGVAWLVPVPGVERAVFGLWAGGVTALALCSHLLADTLTPMGVALFWPLSRRRYSLGVTAADSAAWNLGLFAVGVFATVATALLATPVY